MDPAKTTSTNDTQSTAREAKVSGVTVAKEQEPAQIAPVELVQEVSTELEIPKEVEKAGVEKVRHEEVVVPPDLKKLGVTTGATPAPSATVPQVTLPISDQNVVAGLHAQLISSLRWLATWCIRKLKKAHVVLKVIHGKIIRVKS